MTDTREGAGHALPAPRHGALRPLPLGGGLCCLAVFSSALGDIDTDMDIDIDVDIDM